MISNEQAHSGTQSLKLAWQWNGNANVWLRLTIFNTTFVPNPTINFSHKLAVWAYVPSGTPDFYLAIGVRETGSTASCAGKGGTTGGIEGVGSSNTSGPP